MRHNFATLFCVINLCLCFISRFVRFYEDFILPFSLFLSLSLSPLYPFHLSLSLSLLFPTSPLYLSFYLSFYLSLSLLSLILFGVSNGRFSPCYYIKGGFQGQLFTSNPLYKNSSLHLYSKCLKPHSLKSKENLLY